jgi:glycosyltransferase involved in cell wall biosynthesis
VRDLSVVVIGLNEEKLLASALRSVLDTSPGCRFSELIYVDSGSCDRSVEIASGIDGFRVLLLNSNVPSAAKARNLGLRNVHGDFVQLLDGDSVLQPGWLSNAMAYLIANPDVACVFGQVLEMNPDQSIYMRVCGLDWHVPQGEYRLCGGNAMWRREVLEAAVFFDEKFAFGEEPDLCYRVRQKGWRIRCIDAPMVKHDLGMTHFSQYWRRAENSGKAYIRVAARYWRQPEKLWLYESVRNFVEPALWITILTAGSWFGSLGFGLLGLAAWVMLRTARTAFKIRNRVKCWQDAFLYGFHTQLIRLPIAVGQIKALFIGR